MTDNLVDTRAHAFWESAIVERRRIGIPLDALFMTYPVQFIGCHSRSDVRSRRLEDFPCQLLSANFQVCYTTEKAVSSQRRRRAARRTLQTFFMPSISSLVRIFTAFSRTISIADCPCAARQRLKRRVQVQGSCSRLTVIRIVWASDMSRHLPFC